jgi:hypothetical protein
VRHISAIVLLLSVPGMSSQNQVPPPSRFLQGAATQSSSLQPELYGKSPACPDLPLDSTRATVMNAEFLVRHRSALNRKTVEVQGVVIAGLGGDKASPRVRGMDVQPSIMLAGSNGRKKQSACWIRVLLPEGTNPQDYHVGTPLRVRGIVQANESGVVLLKPHFRLLGR